MQKKFDKCTGKRSIIKLPKLFNLTLLFILVNSTIILGQNTPPEFVNAPDSIQLYQNTQDFISVWDIVQDAETSDDSLEYFFAVSETSIELFFDNFNGELTISPINDFFGTAFLDITARDPQLEEEFITITLNVEPDNTPPEFVNLPVAINFASDSVYILNIWPYVADNETSDENLLYTFSSDSATILLTYFDVTGDLEIDANGYIGIANLSITIEDELGESVNSSIIMDIEQGNIAPQFVSLPDTLFLQPDSSFSINLWPYVEDDRTTDASLIYSFMVNPDTVTFLYEDFSGDLQINPNGYIGEAMLQIVVEDENNVSSSADIVLYIEQANTAPQFIAFPDTLFLQSDSPHLINLWPYVDDDHTTDVDLNYSFFIDNGSITSIFEQETGNLQINPNGFWGLAALHVTVKDAIQDSIEGQIILSIDQVTSITHNITAREFSLNQNYPNPFNPTTQISYQIAENSDVTLKVFDITGREKATLVNTRQTAGKYTVYFDASSLPSGVYFYRLATLDGFVKTKRMMLVK